MQNIDKVLKRLERKNDIDLQTIDPECSRLVEADCYSEKEANISQETEKNQNNDSALSCPICFADFEPVAGFQVLETKCKHVFHWECLEQWVAKAGKESCPVCRSKVFWFPDLTLNPNIS